MNGVATRKTLVSGAIAVAVIVTLALVAFNGQSLVGFTHAEFEAQVESAIGVHQYSSDVRVRGLRVGEVTGVEAKDESAVVRFRIDPDIDVYADARLALRLKNILGEKYLELEPGTSGGPIEGPIPLSATETSTDLGALVGSASGPLSEFAPEDLADARAAAKSLTAEHAPTLTELLDSARGAAQRVTDDTASGLGAIDDLDTLLATLAANRRTSPRRRRTSRRSRPA